MYLGLDIGTTSVCAVLLNDKGMVEFTATADNKFGKKGERGERTQDAEKIWLLCKELYEKAREIGEVSCVGVSGQMHGILYVDEHGNAVSPLYSWQDERGNQPFENSTYAKTLSALSGHKIATGYGLCSVFYDHANGEIPKTARSFCTIGDYIAMRLADQKSPVLHSTNAASLGLFDVKNGKWDLPAVEKTGLPFSLFPQTQNDLSPLGKTTEGALVFPAVGDNQASVYGSVKTDGFLLVNVGTGSQISLLTDEFKQVDGCDVRPYFGGKYLLLGCGLCGGYSYRLLKDFFSAVAGKEIGYDVLNQWAKQAFDQDLPHFSTRFRGTREDPSIRAEINNLSEFNFNPPALTLSALKGISGELKDFYTLMKRAAGKRTTLIASGNAVRMNPVLKRILEEDYGMSLSIPAHKEEAAFGAALLAAEAFEGKSLKRFIRYENE